MQAQHLLEHRAEHRHESGAALGEPPRELGLARPRLEGQLEPDRPHALRRLRHPAAEHAHHVEHLLVGHARRAEGGRGAHRLDVEVGERDGVGVGHRQPVRAPQRDEQVERDAGRVGDVAQAVARRPVDQPLGEEEHEQAVPHGAAELVEARALGLEAPEQLEPRGPRIAVEAVEQPFPGEVHAHPG